MLQSTNDLKGRTIGATDGKIRHAQGMLVEEDSWIIHCLAADTRNE